jgi:hypothetical protein
MLMAGPKNPTFKQKKAVKIMGENGGVASAAMIAAGYSPATAKNPEKLTKSQGFKTLGAEIPNSLVIKKHFDLLQQKQLNYFVFNKDMPDEEIREHLASNGLDTVVIRPSDKGKLAFYSINDPQAVAKGLDMAYKLKGAYAAEKHEITIPKPIMDVD